jgi:hypothetical protein
MPSPSLASGLNRTLGTRPRPSSQLAEERRGPACLQTFGTSREGDERTLRLTGVGPSRQIRRIFSHRTFLKAFDLPVKLHPMMFRPLEYRSCWGREVRGSHEDFRSEKGYSDQGARWLDLIVLRGQLSVLRRDDP